MLLLSRRSMNLTALLNLMGVMVTVYGKSPCPNHCKFTETYSEQYFKHVSDLKNSSVAPWSLSSTYKEGRVPYAILNAVCKKCIKEDMVPMPIYIQISVYERTQSDTSASDNAWCRCPYNLAVGCTCVSNEKAIMTTRHQKHVKSPM